MKVRSGMNRKHTALICIYIAHESVNDGFFIVFRFTHSERDGDIAANALAK